MPEVVELACNAAREGAVLLKEMFYKTPEELRITHKAGDAHSPVSIIDKEIARHIQQLIRKSFPDHNIFDEELGHSIGGSDYTWYIDPLDGTSNVLPQLELSVVGIGVCYKGEPIVAVVGNPFEDTLAFGEKGSGAFMESLFIDDGNNKTKRLSVSSGREWNSKYAEMDSLFNTQTTARKCSFLSSLAQYAMNVRMLGSHILSWTHLAQGRADIVLTDAIGGYWDTLPGIVLVPEAGGIVTDINGNIPRSGKYHVALGTNGEDHKELLKLMQSCYRNYNGFR
jgi:myo-inositol-1(or 4)-monophosphatase